MTKSVMVQGTTSGAGKTMVTALLCRHFARKGVRVAPFKAQNLSLNSYVTLQGEEIGISQAFQAWAAGLEPEGCMNPILLKPRGEGGIQLVLNGRPYCDLSRSSREVDRALLLETVECAYHKLARRTEVVVVEGSGSPAEINLRSQDVANMRTAEVARSPVIIVGDIDKGGVFAGIYGTYHLIEDVHRPKVKAFLINRFRGDGTILYSGIRELEALIGVPCLGVLPFVNLKFPSEDSLDMESNSGTVAGGSDIRKAWLSNLDAFLEISSGALDYDLLEQIVEDGL